MSSHDSLGPAPAGESLDASFARSVCLSLLRDKQNEDGGWGFHPGSESRVEPTCWALLALLQVESTASDKIILQQGLRYLRRSQLPDGSWPSTPGEKIGCWVTSLACWVLSLEEDSCVAAGLEWLCRDWPMDSSLWRRFLRRFNSERRISPQNDAYRGWGWNPRTSSWVEPTSFALIVLGACTTGLLPANANRRRQLGEAMLYDRMCPGGGWNCGNPSVYGVPGEPLVIPTVWALLALRDNANRLENQISLDWLLSAVPSIQSLASFALARICVENYGRRWPVAEPKLRAFHERQAFVLSIPAVAWTCLGWNAKPRLFAKAVRGRA